MRNKRLLRTLSALCLTLVLASGFTVPAFAQGAAPPPAEDTTNDSNVVVEETEKAPPLTPDVFGERLSESNDAAGAGRQDPESL